MQYFEVSALNNTNINELFENAVSKIYSVITSKENEEMDDKALDKIGIKKFGDISGGGANLSEANSTLGSIKKKKRSEKDKELAQTTQKECCHIF